MYICLFLYKNLLLPCPSTSFNCSDLTLKQLDGHEVGFKNTQGRLGLHRFTNSSVQMFLVFDQCLHLKDLHVQH